MSETAIMRAIHEAVVRTGRALMWRNNVGRARFGASWVQYGLGVGSPDLVGLVRGTGRMLGLEVKTEHGRLTPEQRAWRTAVVAAGGVVACVRTVDQAIAALAATERPCTCPHCTHCRDQT